MSTIVQYGLWTLLITGALYLVRQMILAQVDTAKEQRITSDRAAEYRGRSLAELARLQGELCQIENGQTLASGGRGERRVWLSVYRGNLRLHWRCSGGTLDQQLAIGYDVMREARLKLLLIY